MFINVKLLNGLEKLLWYKVPIEWNQKTLHGVIIQVPLRNKIIPAIVIDQRAVKPSFINFSLKTAHAIEPFPHDLFYHLFIKKLNNYYVIQELYFIQRIKQFVQTDKIKQKSLQKDTLEVFEKKTIILTDEQKKVCDFITPHITQPKYTPTVLHGITGSGKTECYKQLITHTISLHKTALLLFPEVTLAKSFEERLKKELPNIPLFGFHSGKTAHEKKLLWEKIVSNTPLLIIGVHLPILLPIANLGLIIIDEEHDCGYQEKKHPKINTKEIALLRAYTYNIPILLGSATPSLQTLYNIKTKQWHFFQLKKRFAGSLPIIKIVLLTDKKKRNNFWISTQLETAIKQSLNEKKQAIIFLNRRGFSFFVQCKECSFIFLCTNCSVSLTLHNNNILTCHYCGITKTVPPQCPSCNADEKIFLKKGIGTQKVVSILQTLFPSARIARADLDITTKKKQWQDTMNNFSSGALDILVGTQTITKGFHFPHVSVVGILWADLNLHFPVYNAAETTLQQLIQVSGRAGRHFNNSIVIVQTMINHSIFSYIQEEKYLTFYSHEMKIRKELGYPPFKRLAEIEIKYIDEAILEREALDITHFLWAIRNEKKLKIQILGPAKPPVHKIKKIYIQKIYLKSCSAQEIKKLFEKIDTTRYKSSLFFTLNPLH